MTTAGYNRFQKHTRGPHLLHVIFVLLGLFFTCLALNEQFRRPERVVAYSDIIEFNIGGESLHFYAKLITDDIFSAGNPIDIYSEVLEVKDVKNITLQFHGAEWRSVAPTEAVYAGEIGVLKKLTGARNGTAFMESRVERESLSGSQLRTFFATSTGLQFGAMGDLKVRIRVVMNDGKMTQYTYDARLLPLSPVESLYLLKLNKTLLVLTYGMMACTLLVPGLTRLAGNTCNKRKENTA